jgi:hypothetical protein
MCPVQRALAALGLVLAGAAPAGDAVREEVVAVVRGPGVAQPRVITLTRLEEEARIALVSRGGTAAATDPLDARALRAALEWVVDQTLLGDEVARLQIFEVSEQEVEAELRRFRERFASTGAYRAFLDRLELPEEEVAAVLRRGLRVDRYVESRAAAADPARTQERARALVADLRARSEVRVLERFEGAR